VVHGEGDIAALPSDRRLGLICQTTQPIERVLALVEAIRAERPGCEVRFVDTVCQPTKNRQLALRKLLAECETLVVVGGRNSNNTLQLVAAAEVAGRTVFHVERAAELRPEWFEYGLRVGVTAGTSTLRETVEEVRARLAEIAEELQPATR
jgi:4-hydroxy-3-methylbut-2-enyl diphosphate reductase